MFTLCSDHFSPSFMMIGLKLWIFYKWSISESVPFFIPQSIHNLQSPPLGHESFGILFPKIWCNEFITKFFHFFLNLGAKKTWKVVLVIDVAPEPGTILLVRFVNVKSKEPLKKFVIKKLLNVFANLLLKVRRYKIWIFPPIITSYSSWFFSWKKLKCNIVIQCSEINLNLIFPWFKGRNVTNASKDILICNKWTLMDVLNVFAQEKHRFAAVMTGLIGRSYNWLGDHLKIT